MYNLDKIRTLNEKRYPNSDRPFLQEYNQYCIDRKPYKGLKILHNTPLTFETLAKLEGLLLSEAEITVSAVTIMPHNENAAQLLVEAGVKVQINHDFKDEYDLHLDCCAELYNHRSPRIGAVELTRTGAIRYIENEVNYPVINVDGCIVKDLETILGTGEGFYRAFKELTQINMVNKNIILFGFGKVGYGIYKTLANENANITICDVSEEKIQSAQNLKLKTINGKNGNEVNEALKNSDIIITATGRDEFMSDQYDVSLLEGKILANMGAGDEFGKKVPESWALANKAPINFVLDRPTLMKYIDPIFYLHNLSADLLISTKMKAGVINYPDYHAREVLNKWQSFHNESLPNIGN